MKSWKKPTNEVIDKALGAVKKETDRRYFFLRLKNPLWLEPLIERGYFKEPPGARELPDGKIQFPYWPEIQFLKNVAGDVPEEVIKLILRLPKTDNSRIYEDILDVALMLKGKQSARLAPKVHEYADLEHQFFSHRFPDIIAYWGREDDVDAALRLARKLIRFRPDPLSKSKRADRRQNPSAWGTSLEPTPRLGEWEYRELLTKGFRPLVEREPLKVALLLIDATSEMIQLSLHRSDLERGANDLSEVWCPRLDGELSDFYDPKADLVHALTYACKEVFEKCPESRNALNDTLCREQWHLFKRVRQHLYAAFPNDHTKEWIRRMILEHQDYDKWEHHYEFQRMVQEASQYFQENLLSQAERGWIFTKILSGPSKETFREFAGDQFSEESFEKRQRYFHLKQLRPFEPVLFGEHKEYFIKLKSEEKKPITDDDYAPFKSEGAKTGEDRSPKPVDELRKMADEELLSLLNEWEDVHRDPDKWWVEVNFKALARAFQSVFLEQILPDSDRLGYWLDNKELIKRPIYVRAVVFAIHEYVKEEKDLSGIAWWFEFFKWVLLKPNEPRKEEDVQRSDVSSEHPYWGSCRRAVGDFIESCISKEVNFPISSRKEIGEVLGMLCTQPDWSLDLGQMTFIDRNDQIAEAINRTRSRALEQLVDFGYWVRRYEPTSEVREVFEILEVRWSEETHVPLTLPERALLGREFGRLFGLNQQWALKHREMFFPEDDSIWLEAFGSFIRFNRPYRPLFEALRSHYERALDRLETFTQDQIPAGDLRDRLGQHVFTYYLWGIFPLESDDSLLAQFYDMTAGNQERRARLFGHVVRILHNSNESLNDDLKKRVRAFFEARLEAGDPEELKECTFWLEMEPMPVEWRLATFSRILDVVPGRDIKTSIQLKGLAGLLNDFPEWVVECLAKMTVGLTAEDSFFFQPKHVRPILRKGLRSENLDIRKSAECARENLLKVGQFEFLHVEEEDPD